MRFGFRGPLFEDGLSSPGFRGLLVRCWAIFFALRRSRQVPPLSLASGLIMLVSLMAKLRSKPSSAILDVMTNFWFCLRVYMRFSWLLGEARPAAFFRWVPPRREIFSARFASEPSLCALFSFLGDGGREVATEDRRLLYAVNVGVRYSIDNC